MIKAKRIFSVLVLMTAISLLAGSSSSLFAQTAKESQAAQEASTAAAQTQAVEQKTPQKKAAADDRNYMMVKTYELKFISATEFMRSARFYVLDSTGTESSLTVRIYGNNIPEFEALLKKLDVEKRNIQFQVYTIIASKDQPLERFKNNFVSETQGIADKDLKRVLDEMKGLWNFKYYWVDSPSFLVVKDGAAGSMFKLVSPFDFDMNVLRVQLRGDEPGKRIISVGQIRLSQTTDQHSTLIDTSDVTFKEKGYLVVGVSGFQAGWSSSALILVISAEIK
jgi:outer membrane murein-binding lipoprotein Lpp